MLRKHLRIVHGFKVLLGDDDSQAAQITLPPGDAEGVPDNRREGADR
jgi:hypothetical protein